MIWALLRRDQRGRARRPLTVGRGLSVAAAVLLGALALVSPARAADPLVIVALGDSLTAGYGVPQHEAFPVQLEAALRKKGHDVVVRNAGVSGDTASGGLARLAWAVPRRADAVIVELGANDALRGKEPQVTKTALATIIEKLQARHLPVLLAGMLAPSNYGPEYEKAFNAIYPALARKYGVPLYPFFLDGVALKPDLNQDDGMHPTPKGVAIIVRKMLPAVENLIERARRNATAKQG